jgi:hypothetical protein
MRLNFVTLAVSASIFVGPVAYAACPGGQFYLDLKGTCSAAPLAGVSFVVNCTAAPVVAGCPAAAGWKVAVLKMVVPVGCSGVNVEVAYEGLPHAWSINLGDSPTNDGYAGDGGTTDNDAELWILEENLSVATSGAAPDNPLATAHLALTDGGLKLVAKNQFVSWGNPYSFVQAPNTRNLFAIPDPTVTAADQRALYLGLNRTIGNGSRSGCGARRVLVTWKL